MMAEDLKQLAQKNMLRGIVRIALNRVVGGAFVVKSCDERENWEPYLGEFGDCIFYNRNWMIIAFTITIQHLPV